MHWHGVESSGVETTRCKDCRFTRHKDKRAIGNMDQSTRSESNRFVFRRLVLGSVDL